MKRYFLLVLLPVLYAGTIANHRTAAISRRAWPPKNFVYTAYRTIRWI